MESPQVNTKLLPQAERICSAVLWAAIAGSLVVGLSNLVVWYLEFAQSFVNARSYLVMRVNTSLGLIFGGVSLLFWRLEARGVCYRWIAQGAGFIVAMIGGLTSYQYFTGQDLGIDEWLAGGSHIWDVARFYTSSPGRMSLNASLSLFFVGLALWLLDASVPLRGSKSQDGRHVGPVFAFIAALPAIGGVVGYLVRAEQFTGLLRSTNILLHTAAGLLFLCVGVLSIRPYRKPVSRLLAVGSQGVLLRWMLPGTSILLLALGWLVGQGHYREVVAHEETTALMLFGSLVLLFILIAAASRAVARVEEDAWHAADALRVSEQRYRTLAEEHSEAKQEAELANRAKDDFLATLSHELRTPLTPVLLSASALLQDDRLSDELRHEIAMIERNVELERRLIDDLLDITRISRGKLTLQSELCDMHSMLGHALEMIRAECHRKGVTLETKLDAGHHCLMGDEARLLQVLWNLLRNSVKFTPPGGKILVVTSNAREGEMLEIAITDTGIGFSPTRATTIFKPFEQESRESSHKFGGLGLGLAIARAIVDLHHGEITASSPGPSRGATFVVVLPCSDQKVQRKATATHPITAAARKKAMMPLRILLVEDHEATLIVLMKLLQKAGHTVRTASCVADGVHLHQEGGFDVIISDLGLPDGSGADLMQQIRRYDSEIKGIALSGYGMEKDLAQSKAAGFTLHLVKPVVFDELLIALEEVSSQKSEA